MSNKQWMIAAVAVSAAGTAAAAAWLAWSPARVLQDTFAVSSPPEAPLVVMNRAGRATVAWNAVGLLSLADRLPSGAWLPSRNVPGANSVAGPIAVALGPGGVGAYAWTTVATRYVPSRLMLSLRQADGVFRAPVEIASGTGVSSLQLGIDCAGTVTLAWADAVAVQAASLPGPGASGGICAAAPGPGPWPAGVAVSDAGVGAAGPTLAVDDAGDVVLAWQEGAPSSPRAVMAAVRPAGGAWQTPELVSGALALPAGRPVAAIDAVGTGVVSFQAGSGVAVSRRPPGGPWQAAEVVTGAALVGWSSMACDDAGDVLLAWQAVEADTGATSVWQRRWRGGAWDTATRLTTRSQTPAWPAASLSADGRIAVVGWSDDAALSAHVSSAGPAGWVDQNLGAAWWQTLVPVAAGGGKAVAAWPRTVNGNPNAVQIVGRGTF